LIRLACPECSERLVLDDDAAGRLGECPECAAHFRIPGTKVPRNQKALSRRPVEDEEEEEEEEERPRRKKKRKRGSNPLLAGNTFTMVLAGLGGLTLILVVLTFLVPAFAVVTIGIGWLVSFCGGIWILIRAFQESVVWGIGCLLVPFVSLIFVIMHFDECWRPFVLNLFGAAMIGCGLAAGMSHL
jgi:hypothetical protein